MTFQLTKSIRNVQAAAALSEQVGLRLRIALFVFLCGLTVSLILLSLPRLAGGQVATIKFDMEISAGKTVGLFVNTFERAPTQLPIVPGVRQIYAFGGVTSNIQMMRLDLTDTNGATVTIYDVTIDDEQGVLRRIAPVDVTSWGASDVRVVELTHDFAKFMALTNHPYLMTGNVASLRRSWPVWITDLLASLTTIQAFVPILLVGFILVWAADPLESRNRSHLLIGLATGGLVVAIVPWLTTAAGGLDSTAHAVGRAGFMGTSTRGNTVAVIAVLAVAGAWGTAAGLLRRRVASPQSVMFEGVSSWPSILVGLALVTLVAGPDIGRIISAWSSQSYVPDWDGNIYLLWTWLAHEGYLPLRDFWFPYGSRYLFELQAPWGPLLAALYRCWVFGMLFAVAARLTGRPLAAVALALFACIGESAGLFIGVSRFLVGLLVALSYVALARNSAHRGDRFLFWLSCALAAVIEPTQLVFAAPAIALILGFDLYQTGAFNLRVIADRLMYDFGVPAIFVTMYFAGLVALGEGPGLADFYLGLGDQSVSSAEPTDLAGAAYHPLSVQFLNLVGPFVLLAIGISDRVRAKRGSRSADVMIAFGLVGVMILFKHLVRNMNWQPFFLPCLGFAFYLMFWRQRGGIAAYAILGLVLGAAASVLIQIGAIGDLRQRILTGPQRAESSLMALELPKDRIATYNSLRFAPERFDLFSTERAVIADLSNHAPDGRIPTIFVLGDTPVLYIMARQKPPYHANDYNASPIYEQKKVADFVNRERPPVVIWDSATQNFDLVQSVVRNPLTYDAVIAAYVPDRRVGRFDLLRPRTSSEPVALDFWRDRLGPRVDYGHLARASSFAHFRPCGDGMSDCQEFLVVSKRNPAMTGRLSVAVNIDGRSFEIAMQTVAGEHELHVSLDRLWFWGVMKAAGLKTGLDTAKSSPEIDLSIRLVARQDRILY